MLKWFLIIIVVVIILGTSAFIYNWHKGRTAPSVAEKPVSAKTGEATAYFAGGCFWCVEADFEKLDGVKEAVSGYMGGEVENPSYEQVALGGTGHREMVKVVYDDTKVSYAELVLYLLRHSDPTDAGGSFYDRGSQYTSAIFYQTEKEKEIANAVIKILNDKNVYGKPVVTSVESAGTFYIAEDYHQDYYKKNPVRYGHYRKGSGRDAFIEKVWGSGEFDNLLGEDLVGKKVRVTTQGNDKWKNFQKPSEEELQKTLTDIQYKVTQEEGTERPFYNEYFDNHEEGIYVDIISGEPLFSSTDKYDSGTGWPSFLKPIDKSFVTERDDYKLILPRTEIRSAIADSHLGHIIMDGPESNDYVRYCMNSAAMRFVSKESMEKEGYGDFLYLFE